MKFSKRIILVAVGVMLCIPSALRAAAPEPAFAVSQAEGLSIPVVLLQHWSESGEQERLGFLLGFLTAVEMERVWQGATPLPLRQSLTGNWSKGLAGVPLRAIYDNVNTYVAANPTDLNRPLVEYLWFTYVQPKVTETVDSAKVEQVKKSATKKKK